MKRTQKGTGRGRLAVGAALGGLLAFGNGGAAHALTYTQGDLIAVFVNGSTELEADLGNPSALTNGEVFNINATGPSGPLLGATGGVGGLFTALGTAGTYSAGNTNRTVIFTTDPTLSPQPPSLDNPPNTHTVLTYVRKLPAAQFALDDGAGNGWANGLNAFAGGGFIVNDTNRLAISNSLASSYTVQLGKSGTNQIGGNLPFSTANLGSPPSLAAETLFPLWAGTQTGLNTSLTTELGFLDVLANPAGNGSAVQITFEAVPEPGTLLLVASGIAGLIWAGRRRAA